MDEDDAPHVSPEPARPPTNGATSALDLLVKMDERLGAIEGRLSNLEIARAPKKLDVPQLVSQGIAGICAVAVIAGAILGKIDTSVALAFAGGLAFALPGLAKGRS